MFKGLQVGLGVLVVGWMTGAVQAAEPDSREGDAIMSRFLTEDKTDKAADAAKDTATPKNMGCAPAVQVEDGNQCCNGNGWHIYADGGFLLVKPHLQNNLAYRTVNPTAPPNFFRDQSFNHDLEIGPRIWLGITDSSSGLGARARWFNLDEDTSITASPPPGQALSAPSFAGFDGNNFPGFANSRFTDRIRMDVWDLEGTQEVRTGAWSLLISAGARYTHLVENYRYHTPFNTADTSFGTIQQNRSFDGFGPMMGLEARRPIGSTGITLFAIGRGGVLFGDGTNNGIVYTTTPGGVTVLETYDSPHEDVIPVVELELGAEWSRAIGRFQPFVQAAFVAQNYFGFNSATAGGGGVVFSPTVQAGGNLGLIGLAVNAGVRF